MTAREVDVWRSVFVKEFSGRCSETRSVVKTRSGEPDAVVRTRSRSKTALELERFDTVIGGTPRRNQTACTLRNIGTMAPVPMHSLDSSRKGCRWIWATAASGFSVQSVASQLGGIGIVLAMGHQLQRLQRARSTKRCLAVLVIDSEHGARQGDPQADLTSSVGFSTVLRRVRCGLRDVGL